jgi:hypothetical protein
MSNSEHYSPAAVAAAVAPAVQAAVNPANLPTSSLPPLVSFPSVPMRSREEIEPFGEALNPSQQYVWNPPMNLISDSRSIGRENPAHRCSRSPK